MLSGRWRRSIAGARPDERRRQQHWTRWLVAFVVFGRFVVVAYNLELFGGAFHRRSGSRQPGAPFSGAHRLLRVGEPGPRRGGRRGSVRVPRRPGPAPALDRVRRVRQGGSPPARTSASTLQAPEAALRLLSAALPLWPEPRCADAVRLRRHLPCTHGVHGDRVQIAFAAGASCSPPSRSGSAWCAQWAGSSSGSSPPSSRQGPIASWSVLTLQLRDGRLLALSAAGLTVCAIAWASLRVILPRFAAPRRSTSISDDAQAKLHALVDREGRGSSAAELERTLARARADSMSMLVDEERRIAEERRTGSRRASKGRRLADGCTRVDAGAGRTAARIVGPGPRPRGRDDEGAHRRADGAPETDSSPTSRSDSPPTRNISRRRAKTARRAGTDARGDRGRPSRRALAAARAELDSHAADRRRALHELDERLRRREEGVAGAHRARRAGGRAAHPRGLRRRAASSDRADGADRAACDD